MHSIMHCLSILLALGVPFANGQVQTISVIKGGTTKTTSSSTSMSPTSTSTTSTSTSAPTKSTVLVTLPSSSSLSSVPTSTIPGTPTTDDPFVLTTIFTQPTDCSTGITQIDEWSTELWQNIVTPVPGVTISSCYPIQFYNSIIAAVELPPLKDIICPLNWGSYQVNSTYIICCPSGYGLIAPSYHSTERPGRGAVCSSTLWPGELMDITSYDATALATTLYTSAGVQGTLVFAYAFDGIAASTTAHSPTATTAKSSTSTATSTSASKVTSTSTSTSASTRTSTPFLSSRPSSSSTISSTALTSTKTTTTATTSTTRAPTITAISQLPTCGQTCFGNMLAMHSDLGCASADPGCVCGNINFYYGIRDCSNGACGTDVASTVIAFESAYCSSALATATTKPSTATTASPTAISELPACGQTCFSNMLGQYAALGCASADPACVCQNINFSYGIRDCSNGACGANVASTVISFESRYCASATAAPTAR